MQRWMPQHMVYMHPDCWCQPQIRCQLMSWCLRRWRSSGPSSSLREQKSTRKALRFLQVLRCQPLGSRQPSSLCGARYRWARHLRALQTDPPTVRRRGWARGAFRVGNREWDRRQLVERRFHGLLPSVFDLLLCMHLSAVVPTASDNVWAWHLFPRSAPVGPHVGNRGRRGAAKPFDVRAVRLSDHAYAHPRNTFHKRWCPTWYACV